MASLTTVALLERRPDISRDLFTRYWRDVHGVMAARIPGFSSYVQHHVSRVGGGSGGQFEGVAVVGFASEEDRQGLANSAISPEIVRDEPNVFSRALLYNLGAGDVETSGEDAPGSDQPWAFALFEDTASARAFAASRAGLVHVYDLGNADPSLWNGIAAGEVQWRSLVQFRSGREETLPDAPGTDLYRTDERFVMVEGGRATPLGLRGADALRTIHEAGATNQLDPHVEALIYGV